MTGLAIRTFLTMLVVIDPIGLVPMFVALAGERDAAEQSRASSASRWPRSRLSRSPKGARLHVLSARPPLHPAPGGSPHPDRRAVHLHSAVDPERLDEDAAPALVLGDDVHVDVPDARGAL